MPPLVVEGADASAQTRARSVVRPDDVPQIGGVGGGKGEQRRWWMRCVGNGEAWPDGKGNDDGDGETRRSTGVGDEEAWLDEKGNGGGADGGEEEVRRRRAA
uniref:Uncharacterized protein n=1 Tax=Oryza brachyantha TaxID=4533 RepID=J3NDB4_ORYBR